MCPSDIRSLPSLGLLSLLDKQANESKPQLPMVESGEKGWDVPWAFQKRWKRIYFRRTKCVQISVDLWLGEKVASTHLEGGG